MTDEHDYMLFLISNPHVEIDAKYKDSAKLLSEFRLYYSVLCRQLSELAGQIESIQAHLGVDA